MIEMLLQNMKTLVHLAFKQKQTFQACGVFICQRVQFHSCRKISLHEHRCCGNNSLEKYLYMKKYCQFHITSEAYNVVETNSKAVERKLELEQRVDLVIEELLSSGIIDKSEKGLVQFVNALVVSRIQKRFIKKTIENHFDLCRNIQASKWQQVIGALQSCGFDTNEILSMLPRNKALFHRDRKSIEGNYEGLRQLSFAGLFLNKICIRNPIILTTDINHIYEVFENLQQIFSKEEIFKLAKAYPKLLTDDWSKSQEKIDYVVEEMGIDVQNIIGTPLFKHTLEHLKYRHLFLYRAGIYETPNKHGFTTVANPSLYSILISREKYFCDKVAKLSVEEFHAFLEIMEKYGETNYDSDYTDSDSDS